MDSGNEAVFFCRTTCGIFLTSVTLIGIVPADIAIGVKYKDILGDSDISCSIRTAFAMFIVATCIEAYLLIWQILAVVCAAETDGCCAMDCYHIEVLLHFTSFGNLAIGVIIFAAKNSPDVWYWYFALVACLSSMSDAVMWCAVQNCNRMRRRRQQVQTAPISNVHI